MGTGPLTSQARSAVCNLVNVTSGAYRFKLSWDPGRDKELRIYLKEAFFCFDAPLFRVGLGLYKFTDLSTFLSLLRDFGLWAKTLTCNLHFGVNPKTMESVNVTLPTPVEPYVGRIGPTYASDIGRDDPIKYVGTGHAPFIGRFLHTPIGGMRFFKYGGLLTTNNAERGFDCITFAGSVFGAQSHMDEKGDKLADFLKGQPLSDVPDHSKPDIVYNFFSDLRNQTGTYLLWMGGHVTVAIDGIVHEFTPHNETGYAATGILDWLAHPERKNWHYYLRKNPSLAPDAVEA